MSETLNFSEKLVLNTVIFSVCNIPKRIMCVSVYDACMYECCVLYKFDIGILRILQMSDSMK